MDRRSFLKGTFAGVTSAGLVIAGADTDLSAFASSMQVGEPMSAATQPRGVTVQGVDVGHFLFNHKGEVVAVVESYHVSTRDVDITTMGESVRRYMAGPREIRLTAVVVGQVNLKVGAR